jgi:methylaspartate ammonia-lyase
VTGIIFAESRHATAGRLDHIQQELEERGFTGAIVANERENSAAESVQFCS